MDLRKVKQMIEGPLKNKNIIILDVSFESENESNYLRITLDTIDLDTVVSATKIINELLDDDISEDSYTLEVLSRGEENE